MGIAKFDDNIPSGPKFIAAGPVACWLWFASVCYSRRTLTDGYIPRVIVPTLVVGLKSPFKHADMLVSVRLWLTADGGYQIHDFAEWNPTKAQVETYRRKDRERKQASHGIRSDSRSESTSESDRIPDDSAYTRAGVTKSESEYSSESGVLASAEESARETANLGGRYRPVNPAEPLDSAFEAFWARYPNHGHRTLAEMAWATLQPDAALVARIHAALDWQTLQPSWQRERGRYVPFAENWLKRSQWRDEPPVVADDSDAAFERVIAGKGRLS